MDWKKWVNISNNLTLSLKHGDRFVIGSILIQIGIDLAIKNYKVYSLYVIFVNVLGQEQNTIDSFFIFYKTSKYFCIFILIVVWQLMKVC